MKTFRVLFAATICACATTSFAQTPAPAQAAKPTDIYHVLFAKAAPGQAAALAKELQEPDPKDPMTSHFILLRHQEGADWDYCLIQHVGAKPSVEIPATTKPIGFDRLARRFLRLRSVLGEFQKVMGLAGDQSGQPVFVVAVQRAVPGHRGSAAAGPEPALTKRESDGEQPGDDPRRRGPVAVPHARPLQLVAGSRRRPRREHRGSGVARRPSTLRIPHRHDRGPSALVTRQHGRTSCCRNRAPHGATRGNRRIPITSCRTRRDERTSALPSKPFPFRNRLAGEVATEVAGAVLGHVKGAQLTQTADEGEEVPERPSRNVRRARCRHPWRVRRGPSD